MEETTVEINWREDFLTARGIHITFKFSEFGGWTGGLCAPGEPGWFGMLPAGGGGGSWDPATAGVDFTKWKTWGIEAFVSTSLGWPVGYSLCGNIYFFPPEFNFAEVVGNYGTHGSFTCRIDWEAIGGPPYPGHSTVTPPGDYTEVHHWDDYGTGYGYYHHTWVDQSPVDIPSLSFSVGGEQNVIAGVCSVYMSCSEFTDTALYPPQPTWPAPPPPPDQQALGLGACGTPGSGALLPPDITVGEPPSVP